MKRFTFNTPEETKLFASNYAKKISKDEAKIDWKISDTRINRN